MKDGLKSALKHISKKAYEDSVDAADAREVPVDPVNSFWDVVLLTQDCAVVVPSLATCLPVLRAGEKLPETAIREAVGKQTYVWAEIENTAG